MLSSCAGLDAQQVVGHNGNSCVRLSCSTKYLKMQLLTNIFLAVQELYNGEFDVSPSTTPDIQVCVMKRLKVPTGLLDLY